MTSAPTGAEARHRIANLLHTYTDIADRKDVAAAVTLLGSAEVEFPTGGFSQAGQAGDFFARLWASPLAHRHDVTNLVVVPGDDQNTWIARAHYTRWVLDPDPVLHTLGEYTVIVDAEDWTVQRLRVTRTWTLPAP